MVALSLVARTVCDLWMIQNGTAVERYNSCHYSSLYIDNVHPFSSQLHHQEKLQCIRPKLDEIYVRYASGMLRHLYSITIDIV